MLSRILIAMNPARLSAPIVSALAILALLSITPTAAQAFNGGIDGNSGSGCTPCHGTVATGVTVSIAGPGTLAVGATGLYTLTITGGATGGALDVSASAGTLSTAQASTQLQNTEITHNPGNPNNAGVFAFNFNLTAPAAPGVVTLAGAGMDWSGNFQNDTGDFWNTTTFTVQIPEPATALLLGMSLVGLVVVARRPRA